MKNKIRSIGNKILVKKIELDKVSGGIIYKEKGAKHGNVWFEIVALPKPTLNPWIKEMEVGGKVLAKEFDYDSGINPEHDEEFSVLDVEPENGSRAGQCHAYIPPKL